MWRSRSLTLVIVICTMFPAAAVQVGGCNM